VIEDRLTFSDGVIQRLISASRIIIAIGTPPATPSASPASLLPRLSTAAAPV